MTEKQLTKILNDLYDQEITPEDVFPIFEFMISEEGEEEH